MKNIVNVVRWVGSGRTATAATVQTVLVKILILGINVSTGVITARTLAPQGRGEQAAMAMWPQFLAYTLTLGLPAALRYNLKRYPEEQSEIFSASLLLSAVLGMAATLIGVVFMPQFLPQYSPEVIHFAQWFMLMAPLILFTTIFVAALEAKEDFTTANQAQYLTPLMTLVFLVLLALTHRLTPFTAVLAYALPTLPIFFWLLSRLWKNIYPHWYELGSSYKRLINYGLRAYGIDLLGNLSVYLDQVLVVKLLTPTSMGLYAVALSLSRMLNLFPSAIGTVLLPKTAARPVEEVIALTGRAVRVSIVTTVLAAIAVMLLGPLLLQILYGNEYLKAIPVFRILVVDVVIGSTTWILAQPFMALGRPGIVTILQGFSLGITVPLMLLFIPIYGLEGAGLALLGSDVVGLIFAVVSFPLILKVRPPNLIITKADLSVLQKAIKFQQ